MAAKRPLDPALITALLHPLGERTVDKSWTNAAGHMRAGHYVVLFEEAIQGFLDDIGCSDGEIARSGVAPVLAEMHVCYMAELTAGRAVAMTLQMMGLEAKAMHVLLTMTEVASGRPAATVELAIRNLALKDKKSAAWTPAQLSVLAAIAELHADLPRPPTAGRAIGAKAG